MNVNVTLPDVIEGVYVGFVAIVLEKDPDGADQLLAFAEPP